MFSTARYHTTRARFRSRVLRKPVVAWRHARLRPSDAFVASYPRSGSTWTLFLLCDALTGQPGAFETINQIIPYVGQHRRAAAVLPDDGRLVRTHETVDGAPDRAIYLVRDPCSVALSEYRWQTLRGSFQGSVERFIDDFVAGRSNPWGSWGDHVTYWLSRGRSRPGSVLVVRYEHLVSDPLAELVTIVEYLHMAIGDTSLKRAIADNALARMQEKERNAIAKQEGGRQGRLGFVGGNTDGWNVHLDDASSDKIKESFGEALSLAGYL